MKIFYSVFSCVLIALIIVTINIRQESTNFYGIAETKEMVINAEFGVEIKTMHITPGQLVHAGDTLVELRSPEIDLKISEYTHLINEMKTRSKTQADLSKSEMRQVKTENESRFIEILSELQELQSQYEINRKLVKQLRSINSDANVAEADDSNPTLIRIQNLKKELSRIEKSNSIMDDNLHRQISFGVDPLKDMLKQYEDQLRLYNELKEKLFIVAPNDGVIGAVYYKKGEMVSAFDSIATLHSRSPSFVLGYIHENIYSSVALGQKVIVSSITDKKNEVIGEVIGVGTRIVEYPIRLRNVQELLMYGREVTIRLPQNNRFLLGEKVIISIKDESKKSLKGLLGFSGSPCSVTFADTVKPVPLPVYRDISWLDNAQSALGIEASGVQYLADIQKYCIISDESSTIYLMDSNGVITSEQQISELEKIDDMEGITMDESGHIYIVCSQNPTKKGKLPDKRRLLMRLSRVGEKFNLDSKIKLIDLLAEAAKEAGPNAKWTELVKIDIEKRSPDIEGVACRENNLYLSFKEPLINDSSAILKINDIGAVFQSNSIKAKDVELWKMLFLKDENSGVSYQISDIQFINNDLYILSSATKTNAKIEMSFGRLYALRNVDNRLEILESFPMMKPEGITFNNHNVLITFDNGSNRLSQFTTLKVSI